MSSYSVFDIAGPVMIGPSSSHTAGAAKLGLIARTILGGQPDKATIFLHGSFGEVYMGHATDKALISGLLGFETDDDRLKDAFKIAAENAMQFEFIKKDLGKTQHPNTAKFVLERAGHQLELLGCSVGGGVIEVKEIDKITVKLDGMTLRQNCLLIWHEFSPTTDATYKKIIEKNNHILNQHDWRNHKDINQVISFFTLKTPLTSDDLMAIRECKGTQNVASWYDLPV